MNKIFSINVSSHFLGVLFTCLIFIVIFIRIYAENTHFLSFDSNFYLEVSQNIINGNGAYVYFEGENGNLEKTFFAVWPLGYPYTIVLTSILTNLDVFLASKLINYLVIISIIYLFNKIRPNNYYILLLVFCSYNSLEVFSYSWSEGLFVGLLFFYCYILSNYLKKESFFKLLLLLFLLIFSFLTRYIGAFLLLVNLILYLKYKNFKLIIISIITTFFIIFYLWNNFQLTGYITGLQRINTDIISYKSIIISFFKSLFNLVNILRNFSSLQDKTFYFTLLFQIFFFALIYLKLKNNLKIFIELNKNLFLFNSILILVVYSISILFFTIIGAVSVFDYRTTFPIYFIVWFILLYLLTDEKYYLEFSKIRSYILIIFLSSLFFNLPKVFIINRIYQYFLN
jgi:hypothetical protein